MHTNYTMALMKQGVTLLVLNSVVPSGKHASPTNSIIISSFSYFIISLTKLFFTGI